MGELMVFFCERAVGFSNEVGLQDEGCFDALVQTALEKVPFADHVFVFRGRRGDQVKLLWWSGDGMNLYRIETEAAPYERLIRADCKRLLESPKAGSISYRLFELLPMMPRFSVEHVRQRLRAGTDDELLER